LVWVGYFFCDGVCAYIGKGANAYFHGAKVGRGNEAERGSEAKRGNLLVTYS
jgi:hypothetical protein